MKNLFLLLAFTSAALFSCSSETKTESAESPAPLGGPSPEYTEEAPSSVFLAGHLVEDESGAVYLLGPEDVKLEIESEDIINQTNWDESFENVEGTPTILELNLGSKIADGETMHTVQFNEESDADMDCSCQVSCGGNRFCCAISGFRTYCSGNSCIQTTRRC